METVARSIAASDGKQRELEDLARSLLLDQQPGFLFRRLDAQASALFHEYTNQTEITPRQFGVLLALYQHGVLSQVQLAAKLYTDRSTLGEMLQRMIERGLIARRESDEDRRRLDMSYTPLGEETLLGLIHGAQQAQQALLAKLPEEYRMLFIKCLRLLADSEE